MVVQITGVYLNKESTTDHGEWEHMIYNIHSVSLCYTFVAQNGYSGNLSSSKFEISSFQTDRSTHNYLEYETAEIWFDMVDHKPYQLYSIDEDDEYEYKNYHMYYPEKCFYKPKFRVKDWVHVVFKNIIVSELPEYINDNPRWGKCVALNLLDVCSISPTTVKNLVNVPYGGII